MIHLETPKKLRPLMHQQRQVAEQVYRPISRQYDRAEHAYPVERELAAA